MMGQHHFNPTAIAAREGRLPPKPKKMSKREQERLFMDMVFKKAFADALKLEANFGTKEGANDE